MADPWQVMSERLGARATGAGPAGQAPPPTDQPQVDPWQVMSERLDARKKAAEQAQQTPPPPPPDEGFQFGEDPYVKYMVNPVSRVAEQAGVPQWARTGATYVLPQTSPELAATGALMLLGGPLGLGAGVGAKGLMSAGLRAAGRGLGAGAAGAGTAAITGQEPLTEGVKGALGGLASGVAEKIGRAAVQSKVVTRMAESTTDRLANSLRMIFGPAHLPADESGPNILARVLGGRHLKSIADDIDNLGSHPSYANQAVPFSPPILAALTANPKVAGPTTKTGLPKMTFETLWKEYPELRGQLATQFSPQDQALYQGMQKRAEQATAIQHWLTGGETDPKKVEEIAARLFDANGRLTAAGWGELGMRYGAQKGNLEQALGPALPLLERSIYRDLAEGLAHAIPGQAVNPNLHLNPRTGYVGIRPTGGRLPWAPGWEQEAPAITHLVPGALRALTPIPFQAPIKYLAPPPEREKE